MGDTLTYLKKQIKENIQTYAIILAMVLIWILFSFLTEGRYAGSQNISNLFRQMTVTALLAVGMVLVIGIPISLIYDLMGHNPVLAFLLLVSPPLLVLGILRRNVRGRRISIFVPRSR